MNRTSVLSPLAASILVAALAPHAAAQFIPVTQERYVQTAATLTSGPAADDYAEATDFGHFDTLLSSSLLGVVGATAEQDSAFSPSLIAGSLIASCGVAIDSPFGLGEAEGTTNLLFIFDLAAPTHVSFVASGEMSFVGTNPDGEPSDLYGAARVRLLNADTSDQIAGFQLFGTDYAADSASFSGTLPAGSYVILAHAFTHIFGNDFHVGSARSASGVAYVDFALVIPAPSAAALLGLGTLALARRRRSI